MFKGKYIFIYLIFFVFGVIVGVFSIQYSNQYVAVNYAKANLFAASQSMKKNDPVQAMIHAHVALNYASDKYDPYEMIGFIYESTGEKFAAKQMYGKAINLLKDGQNNSMLVTKDVLEPAQAIAHIEKKLSGLDSN